MRKRCIFDLDSEWVQNDGRELYDFILFSSSSCCFKIENNIENPIPIYLVGLRRRCWVRRRVGIRFFNCILVLFRFCFFSADVNGYFLRNSWAISTVMTKLATTTTLSLLGRRCIYWSRWSLRRRHLQGDILFCCCCDATENWRSSVRPNGSPRLTTEAHSKISDG